MHKKIAALVFVGILVPLIISCGGSSSKPQNFEPPSVLIAQVAGTNNPSQINQGLVNAEESAGYGSSRSSSYSELSINSTLNGWFAQGQAAWFANGSNSMTFDKAYAVVVATKSMSLPTEPVLLASLNSVISASFSNQSSANSVIPILLDVPKGGLPTEPLLITGSTVMSPVQLFMLCQWLPTEPASPAASVSLSGPCQAALANVQVEIFCCAILEAAHLITPAQGGAAVTGAQATANALCDPQGGGGSN